MLAPLRALYCAITPALFELRCEASPGVCIASLYAAALLSDRGVECRHIPCSGL